MGWEQKGLIFSEGESAFSPTAPERGDSRAAAICPRKGRRQPTHPARTKAGRRDQRERRPGSTVKVSPKEAKPTTAGLVLAAALSPPNSQAFSPRDRGRIEISRSCAPEGMTSRGRARQAALIRPLFVIPSCAPSVLFRFAFWRGGKRTLFSKKSKIPLDKTQNTCYNNNRFTKVSNMAA